MAESKQNAGKVARFAFLPQVTESEAAAIRQELQGRTFVGRRGVRLDLLTFAKGPC